MVAGELTRKNVIKIKYGLMIVILKVHIIHMYHKKTYYMYKISVVTFEGKYIVK